MIVTAERCKYFVSQRNINKTCKLKGRCQLISDKASCSKYEDKEEQWEQKKKK